LFAGSLIAAYPVSPSAMIRAITDTPVPDPASWPKPHHCDSSRADRFGKPTSAASVSARAANEHHGVRRAR
jgi:hypothetical protein